METTRKVNGTLVKVQGDSMYELFTQMARMYEVFGENCQKCGSEDVRPSMRTGTDGNEYLEMVCENKDCRAKLQIGKNNDKTGNLFPKRFQTKDKEYVVDENGRKVVRGTWGWTVWNKETQQEE